MGLVAAPALRQILWPVLALVAAATLLLLALSGERPGLGQKEAGASGPMRHISPASVREIEVHSPAGRWRFVRDAGGWRAAESGPSVPPDFGARLDGALALLHRAAPERIMAPDELAAPAAYGLDPPALEVVVARPQRFAIAFGAPNPLGHARYARIEGQAGIALVGAHVADAWKSAVGLK
jgi:hypothetical protein